MHLQKRQESERGRAPVKDTGAIFLRRKDKQWQMLQKISKENSKAIFLIHQQKPLMILNMAAFVNQWAQRDRLEAAILRQTPD